ncbi:MAG: hypothetical protein ABIP39_08650, partial [Polyangiaceae bacterium]
KGVRVHTVGFDKVSSGFYYFAEGGSAEAVRVDGSLFDMIAPALGTGSNADVDRLLDGLIDRLVSQLSGSKLSEASLELAAALPKLTVDNTGLADCDLEAFEKHAAALESRSDKHATLARSLAEVLAGAGAKEKLSVPLYGEARREVLPALELDAGGKTIALPAKNRWVVSGVIVAETAKPAAAAAAAPVAAVAKPVVAKAVEAKPVAAKVEAKVEPKAQPKAEAKPVVAKAEAKVEPKVEAKVEPKVEAKVAPKIEPTPIVVVAAKKAEAKPVEAVKASAPEPEPEEAEAPKSLRPSAAPKAAAKPGGKAAAKAAKAAAKSAAKSAAKEAASTKPVEEKPEKAAKPDSIAPPSKRMQKREQAELAASVEKKTSTSVSNRPAGLPAQVASAGIGRIVIIAAIVGVIAFIAYKFMH